VSGFIRTSTLERKLTIRSCDLTVNTNFSEIQKLPSMSTPSSKLRADHAEYATFGHFSQAATDAAVADLVEVSIRNCVTGFTADAQAEIADPTTDNKVHPSKSAVPRPTRKVVDPPGGKQNIRLFGEEYEESDALSLAPPRDGGDGVDIEVERMERMKLHVEPEAEGGAHIEEEKDAWVHVAAGETTADVRNAGRTSNPPPDFRPTRKVREGRCRERGREY